MSAHENRPKYQPDPVPAYIEIGVADGDEDDTAARFIIGDYLIGAPYASIPLLPEIERSIDETEETATNWTVAEIERGIAKLDAFSSEMEKASSLARDAIERLMLVLKATP